MSAAAGLDYTDFDLFKEMFPAMWNVGFRCMYHFIGYHSSLCPDNRTPWSDDLKWGYLAEQGIRARFEWPKAEIYQQILEILQSKGQSKTFVISSNADGMFRQNGYDSNCIYNPQGDYGHLQCLKPCRSDAIWQSEPIFREILATVDKSTQKCSRDVIPTCPHCGGKAFMNVRGGNWFIEDVYNKRRAFSSWLNSTRGHKLTIIEIGVGFNTPSVLRWPMEQITESNPNASLIRVNLEHPETPEEISDRSINIGGDAGEAVKRIYEAYLALETR